MFNKSYFKMIKTIFLSSIVCNTPTVVYANNTPDEAALIYQLNRIVESTNLITQDYIWKFELQPDPKNAQVQVKLLNPNQQFEQLNQRAINLAKTIRYDQLVAQHKLLLSLKTTTETVKTPIWPLQHTDRFYINVQFINRIGYKRMPDFKSTKAYILQLCSATTADGELTSPLINQNQRKVLLTLNLTVTAEGDYQAYRISPKIADQEFQKRLSTDLQRIKFFSNNIDGRPTAFQVSQPVDFKCGLL